MLAMEILSERIKELQELCINKIQKYKPPNDGHIYCNGTTDTFGGCWNVTRGGQTAEIHCPSLIGLNWNARGSAFLNCTESGTWKNNNGNIRGDYTECQWEEVETSHGHLPIYVFIIGYSISIILLIIALVIFFIFRQLKCGRIFIHKNLFLSYILTGLSWILYYTLVVLNTDALMHNYKWCQALHIVAQYTITCNFSWMFCEGLYLHTVLTRAFCKKKILIIICVFTGWVFPIYPVAIYAVIRARPAHDNTICWINESSLQWIIYGPIVVSIAINVIFLINIVRLLMTKLKHLPDADQSKKVAKATLVLIPLLGLQYLILPIRPEIGSPLEDAYMFSSAILVSFQGAFVSVMYCFCTDEVSCLIFGFLILSLLSRKWKQYRLMHCGIQSGKRFSTVTADNSVRTHFQESNQYSQQMTELTRLNMEEH